MANDMDPDPAVLAITLLRAARIGSLATSIEGQPFVSLVTPATAPDRSVLLWLSDLAEHTRHLRSDPRCALMVSGAAPTTNPQTAPRLSIRATAEPIDAPALKARWLAIHPYALMYSDFQDFSLWRLTPHAASFVAGFGRAGRLSGADLVAESGVVAAIEEAAPGIMDGFNAGPATMARSAGAWRMVAVDLDGADLAAEETVRRFRFAAAARGPQDILDVLSRPASPRWEETRG